MSMMGHLQKVFHFQDIPKDIVQTIATPASDHLFQVHDVGDAEESSKYLDNGKRWYFHHSIAQLLFISTRMRCDIQTAVAFQTTRVKKPDEDN